LIENHDKSVKNLNLLFDISINHRRTWSDRTAAIASAARSGTEADEAAGAMPTRAAVARMDAVGEEAPTSASTALSRCALQEAYTSWSAERAERKKMNEHKRTCCGHQNQNSI
jgi:hypothetical protein